MKKIIVGITGSIAAYKAAELVRGLRQQEVDVQVVMTEHAKAFITPLTLQALSGKPVLSEWCAAETQAGMDHISLARWADAIICAPASADFIARFTQGMANDLLTTLCLATSAPVFIVPAMNPHMWSHAATQTNCDVLKKRGVYFLGPAEGNHACGEEGLGRMLEPTAIIDHLFSERALLKNQHVLITAGPTQEAIDPVRYLSNKSSGKMGFALAEAAYRAGAKVTVIAGPCSLKLSSGISRVNVTTADQMFEAALSYAQTTNIFIGAAAVADYQVKNIADHKIKKPSSMEILTLELVPTLDILSAITALPSSPFTVGFALETQDLLPNAQKKLRNKKLDMVVANSPSEQTGFGTDTNAVTILYKEGNSEELELMDKKILAQELIKRIADHYVASHSVRQHTLQFS